MKALVFDTGPIINLAMNNLLWILKELKALFKGEFYITPSVKRESVDRPLTSKKFKFEALQVLKLVQDGILKVYEDSMLKEKTIELLRLSNSLFIAQNNFIKNVQYAEIEAIVAAKMLDASAVVIDEFITRKLIENPLLVKQRMKKKLHLPIREEKENIRLFQKETANIKVIRSFELVLIAYEKGLFKKYYLSLENAKKTLLEGLLWAVKLNGCSITQKDIEEAKKIEGFN